MSGTDLAALERTLGELASAGTESINFLSSLAKALFPDGLPDRDKVTWREQSARPEAARALSDEERLRAAEVRFRTLVEQIPAVTFLAVLGDGKNEVYVSPHIEQMLGFTQREWLEAPFLWYWQLHPDDRQLWNEEFTRGCQTGGPFKAECRFIARDGHVVWVRGEARLVKDELGRPMLLQGIAFDITESKKAQEVLLKQATREARQQQELAIAHRVQTSILPKDLKVPGLDLAAAMIPAEDVGGDYYDVQRFDGGAWLAIGDVSGHGLGSGLVMMMLQSALSAIWRARPELPPREALAHVNRLMFENIRTRLENDDHVTLTLIRFLEDGTFHFAGAHEDILVVRKDGRVELLRTPGTWVGGMAEIHQVTVDSAAQLFPGDLMVLYTDGVTEAMDAHGELFELERLCQVVTEHRALPVEEIRDRVIAAVKRWTHQQRDDLTVFVARYTGAAGARAAAPGAAAQPAAPPNALHLRSLLDDRQAEEVPSLRVAAPSTGRMGAAAALADGVLSLRLTGSSEVPDVERLLKLLEATHAVALERSVRIVELDLRALGFLASSCFKQVITWLTAAGAAQRYRVRFVGDPAVRWQRTGTIALAGFAGSLLETA